MAPARVSAGLLWELRSTIVAVVRDREPMEVADDLGHRFRRLLPYGRRLGICAVQFASLEVCGRSFELMNTPQTHTLTIDNIYCR